MRPTSSVRLVRTSVRSATARLARPAGTSTPSTIRSSTNSGSIQSTSRSLGSTESTRSKDELSDSSSATGAARWRSIALLIPPEARSMSAARSGMTSVGSRSWS